MSLLRPARCNRRTFLSLAGYGLAGFGLLLPQVGRSAEPKSGASALPEALVGLNWSLDSRIKLEVPRQAENGSMIPVQIESLIPDTRELLIIVEPNPNPLAGRFEFLPGALAKISLRIRMNESGPLLVIAKTPKANFGVRQTVTVMRGGCA